MPMDWPPDSGFSDHWSWLPDWTATRPRLLWYLTFEHQPEVAASAVPAAGLLEATGADVIPPEWLHLTVTDVGFADEVDDWSLRAAAESVQNALRDAPVLQLSLGPVAVLPGAVVLAAQPVPDLRVLRAKVRGAMRDVGFRPPDDIEGGGEYWPHVSLCYVNSQTDHRQLSDVARRMEPRPVEVRCGRLAQVLVTRRNGHYRWEIRDEVALGGSTARQLVRRST
jgi:2'-5' RNA ligase